MRDRRGQTACGGQSGQAERPIGHPAYGNGILVMAESTKSRLQPLWLRGEEIAKNPLSLFYVVYS